jgi:hypothetical protein
LCWCLNCKGILYVSKAYTLPTFKS